MSRRPTDEQVVRLVPSRARIDLQTKPGGQRGHTIGRHAVGCWPRQISSTARARLTPGRPSASP
jgi:hypothetical protein